MKQWEYQIISLGQKAGIGKWTARIDRKDYGQAEGMAKMGEEGWELVSTELATDKSGYYLFFKRPVDKKTI